MSSFQPLSSHSFLTPKHQGKANSEAMVLGKQQFTVFQGVELQMCLSGSPWVICLFSETVGGKEQVAIQARTRKRCKNLTAAVTARYIRVQRTIRIFIRVA